MIIIITSGTELIVTIITEIFEVLAAITKIKRLEK